jgi:hypothetical protein
MDIIANILTSFTFVEVLILFVAFFLLQIIYKKFNSDEYCSKLHDIKSKHISKVWEFIGEELTLIEDKSLNEVEELLNNLEEIECEHKCGLNPRKEEYTMFSLVLERVLFHDLFEKLKTAVRQNGFYNKDGKNLDSYIEDKSKKFLVYYNKRIESKSNFFPNITNEERITHQDMKVFYRKVVTKAIEQKKIEKQEIKELKDNYSLFNKFKKLLSSLIKSKDGGSDE